MGHIVDYVVGAHSKYREMTRTSRKMEPTMPAYVIGLNRAVRDRQKLEEFWKAAAPTFEGLGAKRLAIYTPLTPLVLLGPLEAAFVYEFPDVGTAKRWYESPAYQKARQLVSDGEADVELFIIDGGYTPPAERLPHIK